MAYRVDEQETRADYIEQMRDAEVEPKHGMSKAKTESAAGKSLPIAYGTVKLPVPLVYLDEPTLSTYSQWSTSTAYDVGDRVQTLFRVYECITAGTSSSSGGLFGGPTDTTDYVTDGSAVWKYLQTFPYILYVQPFVAALCEGPATEGLAFWLDKKKFTAVTGTKLADAVHLLLGPDSADQVLPEALRLTVSTDSESYQHSVLLYSEGLPCGSQNTIPAMAVEIKAVSFGAASPDVNPADIIYDLLTHPRRGCGLDSSHIHDSLAGASSSAATSYRTYCDAAGLRMSLVIDSQGTAAEIIEAILTATNAEAVWSQGQLRVIPLSDQPIASPVYGAVSYTPTTTAVANITTDDLLVPVRVRCRSDADCYNTWPISYVDRSLGYVVNTIEDTDIADADLRGLRRADVVTLPVIFPDGATVTALSRILAQRSLRSVNEYTASIGWRQGALLEPGDIVTLTDPAVGLSLTPVRILEVTDAEDTYELRCEDFPTGVAAAARWTPQAGDGWEPSYEQTLAQTQVARDPLAALVKLSISADIEDTDVPFVDWTTVEGDSGWLVDMELFSGGPDGGTLVCLKSGYYTIEFTPTVSLDINSASGVYSAVFVNTYPMGIGATSKAFLGTTVKPAVAAEQYVLPCSTGPILLVAGDVISCAVSFISPALLTIYSTTTTSRGTTVSVGFTR